MTLLALVLALSFQQPAPAPLEPDGDSAAPSISEDGRFVVFESRASNFVAGDQRDTWDVFLYTCASGEVARISDDGPLAARSPRISGDGRWIVFLQQQPARATPPGTWQSTEYPWKVGLHDREGGSLRWIADARPTYRGLGMPGAASLSRDGGRVVFCGGDATAGTIQIYDCAAQQLRRLNPANDAEGALADVNEPELSRSGRFLVFTSTATTLAAIPSIVEQSIVFNFDDDRHVFRRDLEKDHTEYVSHLGIEAIGYGDFARPHVSDDGRFVAYNHCDQRWMGSLSVGFVSDLEQREPGPLVPIAENGAVQQARLGISWLSGDGRRVLVETSSRAVPVLYKDCRNLQLVLRDVQASTWFLVSRAIDGGPGNLASWGGVASEDTARIAFASAATDLVADDTNRMNDVFLFERATGKTTRIVPKMALAPKPTDGKLRPQQPNNDSTAAQISEDGEYVVFASRASNFDAQDTGDSWDVFLLTCANGSVVRLSSEAHGHVSAPSISGDGRWIAYWSEPDESPYSWADVTWNLKLFDREHGLTETVAGLKPEVWDSAGPGPRISSDGSRLTFPARDPAVKVYDRLTHATTSLTSRALANRLDDLLGDPRAIRGSAEPIWLSPDGSVILASGHGELILDSPPTRFAQIYLHILDSPDWIPISSSAAGEFANRPAEAACASRDLSRVVFESEADNLVPGDTNNARDLFVVERKTGKIWRVGAR